MQLIPEIAHSLDWEKQHGARVRLLTKSPTAAQNGSKLSLKAAAHVLFVHKGFFFFFSLMQMELGDMGLQQNQNPLWLNS